MNTDTNETNCIMSLLSVTIITFNEEKNIGRCIDSIRNIADEVIVLDSFSTDHTVEIAQLKGARVYSAPFRGYIEQKNLALQFTKHNYVLCLDADEIPDESLTRSIFEAKKHFQFRAYSMNRCTDFCGKEIRHGLWYPDRKIRLIDKRIAYWGGSNPHDRICFRQQPKIGKLKGDILHYSYRTMEEFFSKINKYSSIAATAHHENGRKTNIVKILVHPLWAFINGYILRAGFIDGLSGLLIAINGAHYTFSKHIKLYNLQKAPLHAIRGHNNHHEKNRNVSSVAG